MIQKNLHTNTKQAASIQQLLKNNYEAFKKNKDNRQNKQNIKSINFMDLTDDTSIKKKHQECLKTQVSHLKQARSSSIQSYEFAITHLQEMVKSLIQKNEFLNKDRHTILKENYQLKKQVQILRDELKNAKDLETSNLKNQVYNLNGLLQTGNIFQQFSCDEESLDPMVRSSNSNQTGTENNKEQSYEYSSQNNQNQTKNQNFQSKHHSKNASNFELIRQVSNQILIHSAESLQNNKDYQNEPQTPNYNGFVESLYQNINSPKLVEHYLQMNQDLISYRGKLSQQCSSSKQVQISLNNANNMFKNSLQLRISNNESNRSSKGKCVQQFKNDLHNKYTPALPETSQFMTVKCSSNCYEGVFRSFYLSVLQSDKMLSILKKIIQELRNDQFTIYHLYPTNTFWVDMLLSFINIVEQGRYQNQLQILDHINTHKLYDILFIQCLKSRVQFLFGDGGIIDESTQNQNQSNSNNQVSQSLQQSVNSSKLRNTCSVSPRLTSLQLLKALSNEFDLRLQTNESEYAFFQRADKHDQYLLHSQRQSLQISLNNREQCRFYTTDEQPLFRIVQMEGMFYFNLNIRKRQISQYVLNSSQDEYNDNDNYSSKRQFRQNIENSLKGYQRSNSNQGSSQKIDSHQINQYEASFFNHSPEFNQKLKYPQKIKYTHNPGYHQQPKQFASFEEEQVKIPRLGLRQKKIDFNSTCAYGPIREDSLQKMTSSCDNSNNISRNPSNRFIQKRQNKNYIGRQNQVFEEDYFLKKVKSSESGQFFNDKDFDHQEMNLNKFKHRR